ncbi:uncharacterized protein YdcI [Pectinophora gossypiella]|uniref:uncharacterized protein YdcI n=1 Tax=Pectinophora gossypiella TaxID=13191 RepID=UPI00214F17BD|nr:uncharacterized protein YdcI [Pectinophora gossypiella]
MAEITKRITKKRKVENPDVAFDEVMSKYVKTKSETSRLKAPRSTRTRTVKKYIVESSHDEASPKCDKSDQSDVSDCDIEIPKKKPKTDLVPKTTKINEIKLVNKKLPISTLLNDEEASGSQDIKTVAKNPPKNIKDDKSDVWAEAKTLAQLEDISQQLAHTFISLLTEGCTLPFIARYRKSAVDNLQPNRLQELYDSYQNVIQLRKKIKSVLETLRKSNKLTPEVEESILNARNLSEIDLVYAPLKSHSLSLAERARKLGLEPYAIKALNGEHVDMRSLGFHEELATTDKIDEHMTHIVADIIYKDIRVMEQMRMLKGETRFYIQSTRKKSSEKKDRPKPTDNRSDPETYKQYFDWKCSVQFIKPHQTLALNRGEDEKILAVKVTIPDWFHIKLERFCTTLWKSTFWVRKGLGDAYSRLIKPWLSRQVRADITTAAQKEAVRTFIDNVEKYLLTEPIKNRRIAGLDPGFKAGCKVGIIDTNGEILDTCTIYPDRLQRENDPAAIQLKTLLEKHKVQLIGLGNGTACRETESWLKAYGISNNIPVIIVPEQGASVYSISKEAQKEHPNMDPNLISALSIARRVLDPLGELVKVDPKSLGVGLYQHDIPPKMLESALDSAVEKIVSLVGVDLNTASQAMLRRISGLNDGRAAKIIKYRQQKGRFNMREELLDVQGIGKVTYQQCAGFLRVIGGAKPLDATIIHPESYQVAKLFANKINVNVKDITQPEFPAIVQRKTACIDLQKMSKELNTDVCTLELIITAFKQKHHEDNIISFSRPVYSVCIDAMKEVRKGMTLTGVVRNVVPFGCFVDCGVKTDGLVHISQYGDQVPQFGNRVSVTVISTPKPKRLELKLEKILD